MLTTFQNARLIITRYDRVMSAISSIALSGLSAASMRLQDSATKIADPGRNADLADEIVQQLTARIDFAANAQVLKTDARMTASLLDIKV